ncbi:hypothetical protein KC315_g24 [Hortaea werneckii]|nr:hypothetical protein KC315_g24 [Hortaea werneckii]
MSKVRERKRDIVNSFRAGTEARLANVEGLEVIFGEAHFSSPNVVEVVIAGSENVALEAGTFFINTGERPAIPDLPGLDAVLQSKHKTLVLDSTRIQELEDVPEKLIVLGGGYIGLEFGQLFQRLGSKVTIVQRGSQLLPREDSEVSAAVKEIVESEGVEVLLNTQASGIRTSDQAIFPITLDCNVQGTAISLEGSHILLATGRTPNTNTLRLEKAGIVTNTKGHIQATATADRPSRTSPTTTSASSETTSSTTIPQPEQLKTDWSHIPPGEIPIEEDPNRCDADEVLVDGESGEILGFTCLGVEGGEVMSLVQVAMMGKLTYSDLQEAVFAHPTFAESGLWEGLGVEGPELTTENSVNIICSRNPPQIGRSLPIPSSIYTFGRENSIHTTNHSTHSSYFSFSPGCHEHSYKIILPLHHLPTPLSTASRSRSGRSPGRNRESRMQRLRTDSRSREGVFGSGFSRGRLEGEGKKKIISTWKAKLEGLYEGCLPRFGGDNHSRRRSGRDRSRRAEFGSLLRRVKALRSALLTVLFEPGAAFGDKGLLFYRYLQSSRSDQGRSDCGLPVFLISLVRQTASFGDRLGLDNRDRMVTRFGVIVVVGLRVYFGLVTVDVSVSLSVVVVTDVLVSTGVITDMYQQAQVSIAMEGLTTWYCHCRSVHFRAGLSDC